MRHTALGGFMVTLAFAAYVALALMPANARIEQSSQAPTGPFKKDEKVDFKVDLSAYLSINPYNESVSLCKYPDPNGGDYSQSPCRKLENLSIVDGLPEQCTLSLKADHNLGPYSRVDRAEALGMWKPSYFANPTRIKISAATYKVDSRSNRFALILEAPNSLLYEMRCFERDGQSIEHLPMTHELVDKVLAQIERNAKGIQSNEPRTIPVAPDQIAIRGLPSSR